MAPLALLLAALAATISVQTYEIGEFKTTNSGPLSPIMTPATPSPTSRRPLQSSRGTAYYYATQLSRFEVVIGGTSFKTDGKDQIVPFGTNFGGKPGCVYLRCAGWRRPIGLRP